MSFDRFAKNDQENIYDQNAKMSLLNLKKVQSCVLPNA